jgi:hypothetical protein
VQFRSRQATKGERTEAPGICFVILNQYFASALGRARKYHAWGERKFTLWFCEEYLELLRSKGLLT